MFPEPLTLISVLASSRGHWHEKRLRNEKVGGVGVGPGGCGGGEIKRASGSKAGRMQLKERVTDRGARRKRD